MMASDASIVPLIVIIRAGPALDKSAVTTDQGSHLTQMLGLVIKK